MREKWIDTTRGFTIYLMVLGHCIQYATPHGCQYNKDPLFMIIYGFHMPLFMVISGYLFWYSLNKYRFWEGLFAKLKGIMIPCASWGLVTYLCDIIIFNYPEISIKGYVHYTVYSNWFLWAVFYCSLYGLVTKYVFCNHIMGYLVILACNYLIPNIGNYAGAKKMLPFFVIGIILNRFNIMERIKGKQTLLATIIFAFLYCMTLKLQIGELFTGVFGSLLVILIFRELCKKYKMMLLQYMGKVSIVIYLLTGILFYFVIKESFRISESYRFMIKLAYIWSLSIVLTLFATLIAMLLQKTRITNLLFLGRDRVRKNVE